MAFCSLPDVSGATNLSVSVPSRVAPKVEITLRARSLTCACPCGYRVHKSHKETINLLRVEMLIELRSTSKGRSETVVCVESPTSVDATSAKVAGRILLKWLDWRDAKTVNHPSTAAASVCNE